MLRNGLAQLPTHAEEFALVYVSAAIVGPTRMLVMVHVAYDVVLMIQAIQDVLLGFPSAMGSSGTQ
jgi:hypothetical protein